MYVILCQIAQAEVVCVTDYIIMHSSDHVAIAGMSMVRQETDLTFSLTISPLSYHAL